MSGYDDFKRIMDNINYQIQHNEVKIKEKTIQNDASLEYLKNLFGL